MLSEWITKEGVGLIGRCLDKEPKLWGDCLLRLRQAWACLARTILLSYLIPAAAPFNSACVFFCLSFFLTSAELSAGFFLEWRHLVNVPAHHSCRSHEGRAAAVAEGSEKYGMYFRPSRPFSTCVSPLSDIRRAPCSGPTVGGEGC